MNNLDFCTRFTFSQEGGYQCLHEDDGNWTGGRIGAGELVGTNHGISAPVLAHWRLPMPTVAADMQELPIEGARAIAAALFGNPMQIDLLPAGVDLMAFEAAWCCGLRTGAAMLQRALAVPADGAIGEITLAAARQVWPARVVTDVDQAMREHLKTLRGWPEFGRGWIARADRRLAAAKLRIAQGTARQ
jgi:lysozyme family protein